MSKGSKEEFMLLRAIAEVWQDRKLGPWAGK